MLIAVTSLLDAGINVLNPMENHCCDTFEHMLWFEYTVHVEFHKQWCKGDTISHVIVFVVSELHVLAASYSANNFNFDYRPTWKIPHLVSKQYSTVVCIFDVYAAITFATTPDLFLTNTKRSQISLSLLSCSKNCVIPYSLFVTVI